MEYNTFDDFLKGFTKEVVSKTDFVVSLKPDIFNKISEQYDKLRRADFNEEHKEVEEYAKKGMSFFKGRLSRWYSKYGKKELSNESSRKAILENSAQLIETLAYHQCKKLYEEANALKDNIKPKPDTIDFSANTQKFTAKEYALTYILDLYSKGNLVPTNRTNDAGLNKKLIESIGEQKTNGNFKGNTFYKAVKEVLKYDLNTRKDLQQISTDWRRAVLTICNNPEDISKYLTNKGL